MKIDVGKTRIKLDLIIAWERTMCSVVDW